MTLLIFMASIPWGLVILPLALNSRKWKAIQVTMLAVQIISLITLICILR